ncbi:MAG: glycoside hydrolase family 2 TIM barrel-domain containing protein [Salibacteraceae bacterium]
MILLLAPESTFGQKMQAVKVEVRQVNGNYQLFRGGAPYYIKGAGGHTRMDRTKAAGGNSVRTWSPDNAKSILDEAHSHGLTVMMGLWMGVERQGFDYNDEWAVQDQLKYFTKVVRELKDHPALLLWGIGNECDLFYTNYNVWDATNDIAAMIHREDPNHPTCAVTAGIDVAEVQMIMERAPEIDILGINTYGDLEALSRNVRRFGWKKSYIVTEWGPNGHWEVAKTSFGTPIEQTSSEKSQSYLSRYQNCIYNDQEKCIGSYVFHWGNKQETTPTWYGVFLASGEETEAIDIMEFVWSGKYPDNRSPQLKSFEVEGIPYPKHVEVKGGNVVEAKVEIHDPEGDAIQYVWEVLPESTDIKSGGDKEEKPEPVKGLFIKNKDGILTFKAPRRKGPYRLFIYAYDGNGHAATANFPFLVN